MVVDGQGPVEVDHGRRLDVDHGDRPDRPGPFVLLLTDTGVPAGRALGYEEIQRSRWDILDVNGETVIIARDGSNYGSQFDEAAAAAQPIIDSIRFTPSN